MLTYRELSISFQRRARQLYIEPSCVQVYWHILFGQDGDGSQDELNLT